MPNFRSSDPAKQAEGRKFLRAVVAMTDSDLRLHKSAKGRLGSRQKRMKRGGADVPKIPGNRRPKR